MHGNWEAQISIAHSELSCMDLPAAFSVSYSEGEIKVELVVWPHPSNTMSQIRHVSNFFKQPSVEARRIIAAFKSLRDEAA